MENTITIQINSNSLQDGYSVEEQEQYRQHVEKSITAQYPDHNVTVELGEINSSVNTSDIEIDVDRLEQQVQDLFSSWNK